MHKVFTMSPAWPCSVLFSIHDAFLDSEYWLQCSFCQGICIKSYKIGLPTYSSWSQQSFLVFIKCCWCLSGVCCVILWGGFLALRGAFSIAHSTRDKCPEQDTRHVVMQERAMQNNGPLPHARIHCSSPARVPWCPWSEPHTCCIHWTRPIEDCLCKLTVNAWCMGQPSQMLFPPLMKWLLCICEGVYTQGVVAYCLVEATTICRLALTHVLLCWDTLVIELTLERCLYQPIGLIDGAT